MKRALPHLRRAFVAAGLILVPVAVSAATITVGSTTVACDARVVQVTLTADQAASFEQMSFTVTYDAERLSFSQMVLSEVLSGWTLTPTPSRGRVDVQIRPPARLKLIGPFATLTFQLLDQATADRITVKVSAITVLLSAGTTVNGDGVDGMILRDCDARPGGEHPRGLRFRHLAGEQGGQGSVDGQGAEARFGCISGIARANDGTLYVADRGNFTIRRITREGFVSTIAGNPGRMGTTDGIGSDALFVSPRDVAIGRDGTLYVLDGMQFFTEALVRRVTPEGVVTTMFRQQCSPVAANLSDLCGHIVSIAVDAADNVYLLDESRVMRVAPNGSFSVLAGGEERGLRDGVGSDAAFHAKGGSSIAVDTHGNVYVYDNRNRAVRKITPNGVTTTVASGEPFLEVSNPSGIAVSTDGTILVHHVRTLFRVTPAGNVTQTVMEPLYTEGRFALGPSGELYVAEGDNNNELWRWSTVGIVQRIAGDSAWGDVADGRGDAARLNSLVMTYNAHDGLLYARDYDPRTNRCVIRTISLEGDVLTMQTSQEVCADHLGIAPDGSLIAVELPSAVYRIARTGQVTSIAAGPPGCWASGLAVDQTGTVYVSCGSYLAKITPNGSFVVAVEDVASEALAVLPNGELVAANQFRLLRITPAGRVLPFAGTGVFPLRSDATIIPSSLGFTRALAADATGGVYVMDVGFGNWAFLRHVTAGGDVATIAGGGVGVQDGDSSTARFAYPKSIATLPNGGVAVSEGPSIRVGVSGVARRRSVRH